MAEERLQRRLAAVLAADVVGYSRLMGIDEAGTLARLKALRRDLIDPQIAAHAGRIVKLMGDGVLVEFGSAVDAVACAIEIQKHLRKRDPSGAGADPIQFRIGINVGDIIIEDGDIFGDGVNIAARIEGVAAPGGISISEDAWRQVQGKVAANFVDAGEQSLKNIARPVRIYRLDLSQKVAPSSQASRPLSRLSDEPSIAVLAFNNMSGDPEQEYFSDGISEDIITDLSKLSELSVIARNSSFTYKGKPVEVKQVGRELGVRYVLEGSVRKAGNRVRVTAQLIDAESGAHIWADRFDRDLTDIFAVQDELTKEIIAALKIELSPVEKALIDGGGTKSVDAHEFFLRGREIWYRHTKEGNHQALEMLTRALELDPHLASACALSAIIHLQDYLNRWSDSPLLALERGREAALRAVALDDREPYALWALGAYYLWSRRLDEAIGELEKAVSLSPNLAAALGALGLALHYAGKSEEAIECFNRAMTLDPYGDFYLHYQAQAYFQLGNYGKAAALLQQRLTRNPQTDISHMLLAASYGHQGRTAEARAEWAEVFRVNPNFSLEHRRKVLPYRNSSDFESVVEGLRKAGLVA
jgi:adenylate cyclase